MKKLTVALILSFVSFANASVTFQSDTGSVTVSTQASAPTQIMTYKAGTFIQNNILANPTPFNLYVSTTNVGISTTTSAFFPPNYVGDIDGFYPQDVNGGAYQGPLWAVLGSTFGASGGDLATPSPISVFRFK